MLSRFTNRIPSSTGVFGLETSCQTTWYRRIHRGLRWITRSTSASTVLSPANFSISESLSFGLLKTPRTTSRFLELIRIARSSLDHLSAQTTFSLMFIFTSLAKFDLWPQAFSTSSLTRE